MKGKTVTLVNPVSVVILRVTKVGRKYVYGHTIWTDQIDGEKESYDVRKFNLEEYKLYPEKRQDLYDELRQHERNVRKWKDEKEKYYRDVDRELRDKKYKEMAERMNEWDKRNPFPQR